MSAEPIPISTARTTALDTSSLSSEPSSLPLWDRLSTWASENKAVVYTIAGIAVVVTGAGVLYYRSDSRTTSPQSGSDEKTRVSKKDRRKAKKEKDKEQTQTQNKSEPDQSAQHPSCARDSLYLY